LKELDQKLEFWRDQIDRLDRELVQLLVRRTACAIEIGQLKLQYGAPVYDPTREEEVYRNVQEAASGPLTTQSARRIFERIVDETRRAEREHRKPAETVHPGTEGGIRG